MPAGQVCLDSCYCGPIYHAQIFFCGGKTNKLHEKAVQLFKQNELKSSPNSPNSYQFTTNWLLTQPCSHQPAALCRDIASSLLQSWSKHWAEAKIARSEGVSRAISKKTDRSVQENVYFSLQESMATQIRVFVKTSGKGEQQAKARCLSGEWGDWNGGIPFLIIRAWHRDWELVSIISEQTRWELFTPHPNYTILLQLACVTEGKPFHSRQSYHIVNSVLQTINYYSFFTNILECSLNVDLKCIKIKGCVHRRTVMSQNDRNCFVFPSAHMNVESETPWIHFASLIQQKEETRISQMKKRRLKLSTNTIFSARFRMTPQNTEMVILACLVTVPRVILHLFPES